MVTGGDIQATSNSPRSPRRPNEGGTMGTGSLLATTWLWSRHSCVKPLVSCAVPNPLWRITNLTAHCDPAVHNARAGLRRYCSLRFIWLTPPTSPPISGGQARHRWGKFCIKVFYEIYRRSRRLLVLGSFGELQNTPQSILLIYLYTSIISSNQLCQHIGPIDGEIAMSSLSLSLRRQVQSCPHQWEEDNLDVHFEHGSWPHDRL